jgi:uncharacterized protein (TIGR03437 family)
MSRTFTVRAILAAVITVASAAAQTTVPLGTANSYAVLAGSTITNTGATLITGDVGLSPGTAITGFPPGTVIGTVRTAAAAAQPQTDLLTAYNNAAARGPVTTIASELGGQTLVAGVYHSTPGTFTITGILTLDGQNNPNAVFILQADSTLITADGAPPNPASQVVLTNGAQACNIFWQVGSSATLGTYSIFEGSILALDSITVKTGASVSGRVLAQNKAVTLDTASITSSVCPGSIQIVKNAVGGDGTFTFNTNFGLTTLTTAAGTASQTFTGLTAGAGFSATENAQAGWTQTSALCTNGTPAAIGIASGVTTICTFTNTASIAPPVPGAIQVVKNTVGGNGTFTFTSNFGLTTLTTAGFTGAQTFSGLAAGGSFAVSESVQAGWTQTGAVCTNGTPAAVIVLSGVTTICTFTNVAAVVPPGTGSIQVVKTAVGGNGTFTFTSNFGLTSLSTIAGTGTQTFAGLAAGGSFSVSESAQVGWTQTSAVCTNGTPAAVIVLNGATTICTFTNTIIGPPLVGSIQVVKNAAGGNGTFAFTSNFGLTSLTTVAGVGSQTFAGLAAGGSFSVSETPQAGWTQTSAVCSNGTPAAVIVLSGITTVCTFTNTAGIAPPVTGSIQVVKAALGGDGTFAFSTNFGLTSLTTVGGSASGLFSGLTVGGSFSLTETAQAGWTQTSAVCTNGTPAAITVLAGVTTICTITNSVVIIPPLPPASGSIQIVKNTVGGDGTFAFTSNFGLSSLTTVNGTGSRIFTSLTAGGSFSLSETTQAGWAQTGAVCTNGTPAAIVVLSGLTTICTITNSAVVVPSPDLVIAKTHTGNFRQGDIGDTYSIVVTNTGQATTTAAVSVGDNLPAGLIATAMSGNGWACVPGALSCSRSDSLAPGASYPPITVTVNVASNGAAFVPAGAQTFTAGDIFVSMADGTIQWRRSDWSLVKVLPGSSNGQAKGMAFDSAGSLYATHWYGTAYSGNNLEKFDSNGNSLGIFGSGYNCNPSSVVFDSEGNAYVGQADCTGQILKLSAAGIPLAQFNPTLENRGTYDVVLDPNQCTMYYTSEGPDVKRFNVCANTQMANFNTAPLPDPVGAAMVLLPGGGMLVANSSVITRLDASGNFVSTYASPGNGCWLGVALASDGTSFWASNWCTSSVTRFDIAGGNVIETHTVSATAFMVKRIAVLGNTFNLTATNVATVSGGGELNIGNDSASDATTILPPLQTVVAPLLTLVNAASSAPGMAAGSIASAFGFNLALSEAAAVSTPLPTSLAGSSVQFGSWPAPLFFASSTQVNLQIPWELAAQTQASVVITAGGDTSLQTVNLVRYAPGIFAANGAGTGQGIVLQAGTTLLAAPIATGGLPAAQGQYLTIYATGLGPVTNQPATGQPAAASGPLSITTVPATVTIGGVAATVTFAGLAPEFVGVYQVNVQMPAGVASGNAIPLTLTIGGVTSNTVTIAVQ